MLTKQQRKECQNLLQHLAEQLPQLEMEGKLNVWILKPGAESQGRGKTGEPVGSTQKLPFRSGLTITVFLRHHLHNTAGGSAAAGMELHSTLDAGGQMGGTEVRGAAADHFRHQIRHPAMVCCD